MYYILFSLLYFLVGITTGIASGMFGIGGGLIMVPVLFYTLPLIGIDNNILPFTVIGTSLFAGTFASISSGLNHYRSRNVDVKKVILFSIGSVITAFILPFFVVTINPKVSQIILGIIISSVALKMFLEKERKEVSGIHLKDHLLPLFGILVGVLTAFTGLGGGVLFVPILIYFYAVNFKRSIGTSSAIVAFTMFSSAVAYGLVKADFHFHDFQFGYINLLAGIPIGLGAMIGAVWGVKIVLKSKSIILKRIFAVFLFIVTIKIIFV